MRHSTRFALAALTVLCSASAGHTIPQLINYQGVLTDGGGTPITVATNVEFRIWDMGAGGNELWMESQSVTPNADGLFSVLLGSVNPVPDSALAAAAAYLGMTVSPDAEMSPRTQLVSVAYAYRPGTVDGASGGTITGKVSIGPGHTNTGNHAFVAGRDNTASGSEATVGGGKDNTAGSTSATIGGGESNFAGGIVSVVSGGWQNHASGFGATVGGGVADTARGLYSTVPGGAGNVAAGNYSFAAGHKAKARHNGTFVWADNTDFIAFSSTDTNQFLMRATGGVGIGTDTPEAALHVMESSAGSVTANPTSVAVLERNGNSFLSILGPDGNARGIYFGDPGDPERGGIIFDSQINNGFEFRVAGNLTMMVIDQDGDVGIRMTNPTRVLQVVQNTPDDPLADAWDVYSSRRWKENIKTLPDALEKIKRLHGVEFDWKANGQHDIGLIAEEVGEVIPEVVQYEENGVDAESVDYARLVAVLIEGMKEQQVQIESLEQRLRRVEREL